MSIENDQNLETRLFTALIQLRDLSKCTSLTEVKIVEGLVRHIENRGRIIDNLRKSAICGGNIGPTEEILNRRVIILPVAEKQKGNVI